MDINALIAVVLVCIVLAVVCRIALNALLSYAARVNGPGATAVNACGAMAAASGECRPLVECGPRACFDSKAGVLTLPTVVADATDIAALSQACHECGHYLQWCHSPRRLRAVASASSAFRVLSWLALPLGIVAAVTHLSPVAYAAVALYVLCLLVQLALIPCEVDASRRALVYLRSAVFAPGPLVWARCCLAAACVSYLVGALASLVDPVLSALLRVLRM